MSARGTLIFEVKFQDHSFNLDGVVFDTDGTFSLDGKKWYRWFGASPTKSQQQIKTTKKWVEP
jgi:hypothetical protein